MEGGQQVPIGVRRKKCLSKKRYVLIVLLLFLFLASSISAVASYLLSYSYHTDLVLV